MWTKIFTAAAQLQVTTILLAADVAPCLTITSDEMLSSCATESIMKAQTPGHSNTMNVATPVSTPTTSVDHASAAPSPSAGADGFLESNPDSRLLDQTDETWGVVLGIRMRTSNVLGEWCPSLISGLLLKRGDINQPVDPAFRKQMPCIAIHISRVVNNAASVGAPGINASSPAPLLSSMRHYELLMREVLSMYRNLGTLAKVRFIDDGMGGILPWHIMAAMKGAKALDQCLPV